jgi:hypothetical protein
MTTARTGPSENDLFKNRVMEGISDGGEPKYYYMKQEICREIITYAHFRKICNCSAGG